MTTKSQVSGVCCLEDLIKYSVKPLLKWRHLGRDVVNGFIGERGEGKDLGGANLCFRDYMLEGEPCWSNSKIKVTVKVSDEDAEPFGLSGGEVVYESEDLDKPALLRLEDKFKGGVIYISEINMEFSESRRSQTNVNLFFDRVGQQLRKLQSAMIFNVIHEMWIDLRIREISDNFIKTRDTALDPGNLTLHKPVGHNFEWYIYPISRKLCGVTYAQLQEPIGPFPFSLRKTWGIIDTYEKQAAGKHKYGMEFGQSSEMDMEFEESEIVLREQEQWGWLYKKIQDLHDQGYNEILDKDMWDYLQVRERGVSIRAVGQQLKAMGISKRQDKKGWWYIIDTFDLERMPQEKKVATLG